MREMSIQEAFSEVPSRSACVLCVPSRHGGTCMLSAQWFGWLNIKHQPMLSIAVDSEQQMVKDLEADAKLVLAIVPQASRNLYPKEKILQNNDPDAAAPAETGMAVPKEAETVFLCTEHGSYKYPFRKTRIVNCNLENVWMMEKTEGLPAEQASAPSSDEEEPLT